MNYGLILSIIASISTLLGLLIVIIFRNTSKVSFIINITLIVAFIILIYVSIFELYIESIKILQNKPFLDVFLYIVINYTIIYLILKFSHVFTKNEVEKGKLYFLGVISMITLFLHNIPEGIITCLSTNYNFKLGLKISLGIIMHNIPEGIIIAAPIYFSKKNMKRAVIYTFMASLGEIIGALITLLFIKNNIVNNTILAYMMISISSLMILIAVEEIFSQISFKNKKSVVVGLSIGLLFILINILFN